MRVSFGNRLFELRKENELTMDEFIESINRKFPDVLLNKSVVSRYENNKNTPKQFTIVEKIADYFGVDINYKAAQSRFIIFLSFLLPRV